MNFKQTETEVTVRCSDGTFYTAEILVGADGAASTVRTSLYRQMKDAKLLPRVDMEPEKYKHVCLIGVTNPLSSKRYPDLGLRFSTIKIVLNKNSPYMVRVIFSTVCEQLMDTFILFAHTEFCCLLLLYSVGSFQSQEIDAPGWFHERWTSQWL